jgi:asparagine synthase (glutamine-hydrolysing)
VGGNDSIQPYVSCNRKVALVHNGEIYNSPELGSILKKNCHTIDDETNDSEILLHLIEELHEGYDGDLLMAVQSAMKMINGMYVFAVTDGKDIVIARDPFGIKPVYYVWDADATYFSSEKRAISQIGEVERLMPGRILKIDQYGRRIYIGNTIEHPPVDIVDADKAVDLYENVLIEAVKRRVNGLRESRVGVIYSGGVDSVLIAKILQDIGFDPFCYCVGRKDSQDVENAIRSAQDLNLSLSVTEIDKKTIREFLPEIMDTIEVEGLLQTEVAIPMYLAARSARADGIKVLFTGQGADELFAGYWWYKHVVKEKGHIALHEKLWEDIQLMYDDTLEREDKVTMAHSIEMRVPYLDQDLVKIAMRISPYLKIKDERDSMRKWIHRGVASNRGVPDYISYRNKDPVQSGCGIHALLEEIAEAYFEGEKVEVVELDDKGSLYRYLDEDYGAPRTWAYIKAISQNA